MMGYGNELVCSNCQSPFIDMQKYKKFPNRCARSIFFGYICRKIE